jgi:hypothetical protein
MSDMDNRNASQHQKDASKFNVPPEIPLWL